MIPYLSRFSVGLLPSALRTIQEHFTVDRYRTEALSNLLSYLPQDQLSEALQFITQSIKNPYYKASALEVLIPLLGSQYFNLVLDSIDTLLYPQLKVKVLEVVAKALAADTLATVSNRVDTRVKPSLDDINSAVLDYALDKPHLIARILNMAQRLKDSQSDYFSYEKGLSSITSQLAPVLYNLNESQQKVQQCVQDLKDPGYQAAALIALAPFYPEFVKDFLSRFSGDDYRNLLHIKIQLALPDNLNAKSLESLLHEFKNEYRRVEALAEIACHPAGGGYQTDALRAVRELKNNAYLQAKYLQRLIPHLLYHQRLEAANVIGDITDKYHQVSARVALARKFPESEFFNPARDGALALESTVQQIEQLSTLAIDMPELLPRIIKIAEARDAALSIEETETIQENGQRNVERHQILTALAPHLPMRINREVKREWLLSQPVSDYLWNRALYLLARGYRDALKGGSLRNETAQDQDFLGLKDEINALSGLLLMRDLEPPMTVGILGGWGGGKSYIMHLMQAQMTEIRSRKVNPDVEAWNPDPNHEKLSPYVGHIYQIKFDAWTFAKSDLWASLMQTIFFELNRQISLEQQLARVLAENPDDPKSRAKVLCEDGKYWPVLYKASEEDRQWFLERVLSPDQFAKFKAIHNQGQVDDELWKQLGATYRQENEKLKELETELEHKQDQLNQEKQLIRSQIDEDKLNQLIERLTGPVAIVLSNRISEPVFDRINQEILHRVKAQLDSQAATEALSPLDMEHLQLTVQKVITGVFENRYGEISFRSFWTWFKKNLRLFGLLLIFLTLAILLPIAVDWLLAWLLPGVDGIFPKLIAFLAPLTPGIASAQALLKSSHKWFEETTLAVKEYEQQLETIPKQLEARREQLFQDQLEKVQAVAVLEAEIKVLEEKVEAQRQQIPENVYESLEAFVSDRIQEGSYEKRLGLMQQVKSDLAELSRRLLPPAASSQEFQWKVEQLQKVFPRGPARVIVYIDDLDRCPPDRVVQVLEAVQLLVKTPLFIAVLAIDERYITRALEKFYDGVLTRRGRPSGTDYLEKIIQLPYRVRPIMSNTLETYLRSQVVIQDDATGGNKFSEFSSQEFNLLLECCKQVDLTPRTLKRLTNVYKLFKIVCRTRGTRLSAPVQQAILALLALSGRYPNLMRGVFASIEICFEENRTPQKAKVTSQALHLESPLQIFFEQYQLPVGDQHLQLEFAKLKHDSLQTNLLPQSLTLQEMGHEIFNLIRSFSFVGEISESAEDYQLAPSTLGASSLTDDHPVEPGMESS